MVGPDYVPPDTQVPDRWTQELSEGLRQGDADLRTWWTNLDDPTLDRLIERASAGNLDVKQAVARIRQARADEVQLRASCVGRVGDQAHGGFVEQHVAHGDDVARARGIWRGQVQAHL